MKIFDIFKKKKEDPQKPQIKNLTIKEQSFEDLLNDEKLYLENKENTYYDFFGYLGFHDDELPFFEEKNAQNDDSTMFLPFTPKLLSFCVHNLSNNAILHESQDEFKKKCLALAHASRYQPRNDFYGWEQTIDRLCEFVYEKQLLLSKKLDLSTLTEENWHTLGKEFKKHQCLPPSYKTKPANIQIIKDKQEEITARITFLSTTSDNYRLVILSNNDVYVCVNNQNSGIRDEEMTRVWNNFCFAKRAENESDENENLSR